jgi:hypothetical protein
MQPIGFLNMLTFLYVVGLAYRIIVPNCNNPLAVNSQSLITDTSSSIVRKLPFTKMSSGPHRF